MPKHVGARLIFSISIYTVNIINIMLFTQTSQGRQANFHSLDMQRPLFFSCGETATRVWVACLLSFQDCTQLDTAHSVRKLLRGIDPFQRPCLTTQHLRETNIHGTDGFRTCNPNTRVAADRRLWPRGHRDRPTNTCTTLYFSGMLQYAA
jgi:hypothetical protein